MKKLLSALTGIMFIAGVPASMAQEGASSGSLRIGGTIESRCDLQVTQQDPVFDMQNVSPRVVAAVAMTCNRGQEAAAVTYESLGQGLISASGERIDYIQQVNMSGSAARASDGVFRVHRAGGGQQLFSVQPLAASANPTDIYSDVVRVTVSVN